MILTALSVTLWFFYFCVTWQINLCWRSPLIEPTAENSLLDFAGSAVSWFTLGHVWSERVNEFGQMKSIITMLTYCVISVYTPITYCNHYGHFSPWLSGKGRSFSTKCKVWSCQYCFACVEILLWVIGLFMSAWSCQSFTSIRNPSLEAVPFWEGFRWIFLYATADGLISTKPEMEQRVKLHKSGQDILSQLKCCTT